MANADIEIRDLGKRQGGVTASEADSSRTVRPARRVIRAPISRPTRIPNRLLLSAVPAAAADSPSSRSSCGPK